MAQHGVGCDVRLGGVGVVEDGGSSWEDDARALFLACRYSDFLAAFKQRAAENQQYPKTRLLAAKVLSRIGRPEESLEQLQPLTDPASSGLALAVHALAQQSIVEVILGREDRAVACLDRAEQLVTSSDDMELEFHLHLHQALRAWTKRDFARTEAFARSAMSSSHPETLALAGQFLGFVAASRGRYMEQIAILESALADLDTMPAHDLWIEVSLMHNISGIVSDLFLPAVARRMSDRANTIAWTDEVAVARHNILRSLAYFRSLGSDPFLPFEYLDRASAAAPTEAWRFTSLVDRLFLVHEMSGDRIVEDFDATSEIRRAEDLATSIDWESVDGEERLGLLLLAEILAPQRPKDAATYLARYRELQQTMSPLLMAKSDPRCVAIEDFVEGIVVAANAETQRGIELIGKAFAYWDDIGYSWRATRAAIKLYELSGEERYIDWAFRESRRYPASWLSDAVSRAGRRNS
jgi:tetratricopeptide (TPR) repeat protein